MGRACLAAATWLVGSILLGLGIGKAIVKMRGPDG